MTNPVKLDDGTTRYYNEQGVLHNDNGPAVIWTSGDKEWYCNGVRHRTDGPAIEYHGAHIWYINGKKHREDGPAIHYLDDSHDRYFLDGKEVIVTSLTEFIGIVRFKAFI